MRQFIEAVHVGICLRSFMEVFWVWDSPDAVLADVGDHPGSFLFFLLDPDDCPADGLAPEDILMHFWPFRQLGFGARVSCCIVAWVPVRALLS